MILRIERDNPDAWVYMPHLLDRVAVFCERYDPETIPLDMTELIRLWFMTGDRRLGLWIVAEGPKVLGHLLATPEPFGFDQWRYVLIRQAEVNHKANVTEAPLVFDAVCAWTKSLGLSRVVMVTHRKADAMSRAWGFKPYKTIMTRDLKEA